MTNIMSKTEAGQFVSSQRIRKGLSWQEISDHLGRPRAWTISALLGQHPVDAETARKAKELLDLDDAVVEALQVQPYRGTFDTPIPSDPTIYRFYEALNVYGPAIKEMIHEDFGDGIMSAINFNLEVTRREHPDGDRVVVTLDGKFLPYQFDA